MYQDRSVDQEIMEERIEELRRQINALERDRLKAEYQAKRKDVGSTRECAVADTVLAVAAG